MIETQRGESAGHTRVAGEDNESRRKSERDTERRREGDDSNLPTDLLLLLLLLLLLPPPPGLPGLCLRPSIQQDRGRQSRRTGWTGSGGASGPATPLCPPPGPPLYAISDVCAHSRRRKISPFCGNFLDGPILRAWRNAVFVGSHLRMWPGHLTSQACQFPACPV